MEQIKEQLLPGKYIGFYPKFNEEKGESYDVFKYALTGTKEALAEYERITLEKGLPCHKTDEGAPIFFTLDYSGEAMEVKITVNGKIVANDETLRQLQSLAKRTSGIMQEKIAEQGVAMLLGQMFKKNAPVSASTPVQEPSAVEPIEADLNDDVE
jgi:hypothetical protein